LLLKDDKQGGLPMSDFLPLVGQADEKASPFCNYSAIHSKQGCHCERALFASEAVSQSMVFPVQHEIASGKNALAMTA